MALYVAEVLYILNKSMLDGILFPGMPEKLRAWKPISKAITDKEETKKR